MDINFSLPHWAIPIGAIVVSLIIGSIVGRPKGDWDLSPILGFAVVLVGITFAAAWWLRGCL